MNVTRYSPESQIFLTQSPNGKDMVKHDIKSLYSMANRIIRTRPFCLGLYCGVVSVLVDTDHFIAYQILGWSQGGRFLHIPVLIVSGVMLVGLLAYLGRFIFRMVLRRDK